MNPLLFIFSCFLLLLVSVSGNCQSNAMEQVDEIQVLIDVSGSMKQNDPNNKRQQATKLLIELLPEKTKIVIWLFAENSKQLIHGDSINANWKQQAIKSVNKIHSSGLYTDIEAAIKSALSNSFAGAEHKNIILLTDGIVDISKDIMVSADSRERILSELIPKLQQQNIHVQTIALSDQADKELLNKLALATAGWAEQAESAEQLQRLFFKMLTKAVPKDYIPLKANHFSVDQSVKEFSLLAFKKTGASAGKLLTPEQLTIDKNSPLANVAWVSESNYDLVTIQQPHPGEWQLLAEVDPDNKVMIMTDLQMHLDVLPAIITETESLPLSVYFTDQQKLIDKIDFLQLINLNAVLDQQKPLKLAKSEDKVGFFNQKLSQLKAGKHTLTLLADGKTFKREIQTELMVVANPIQVEIVPEQESRNISLNLRPDLTVIDPATLTITANISQSGVTTSQLLASQSGVWTTVLNHLPVETNTLVNFEVLAKSLNGKNLTIQLQAIKLDDSLFNKNQQANEQQEVEHTLSEPVLSEQLATDAQQTSINQEEISETVPDSPIWWKVSLMVLFANVVLVVVAYYIFQAIKKKRLEKQQQLLERLS